MPRFEHRVHSFNAGELSPKIYGRDDLDKYASGVKTMLNFIIQPEGGFTKRSGTRFVKPLQDSSATARLIPFMYSTDTPYILEFGLNYIKVFKNEAPVLNAAENIEGISQDNPAVVTITGHSFTDGQEVYITGVSGMTEVNTRYFTVANAGANDFELQGEDSSAYTAYSSAGTAASTVTITTTYTQAEVAVLEYAQSSDTLYIAHQAHAPAQLTRTSDTAWTLANVAFVDGPYLSENTVGNVLETTDITGSIQIDSTNTNNINGGSGFQASLDIGRLIRIRRLEDDSNQIYDYGHAIVTDVNTTTQVDADVINRLGASFTWSRNQWRLGAFYLTNYPAAVSFGDGRLWWGGTPDYPGSVYGSKSGDFLAYAPSTWEDDVVADDAAVSYTIGINQVSEIKWISSGRSIMLGTPGGVFPLQASSNSEPITPFNVNVPSPTLVRAAAIHPTVVGDTVVYVTRAQDQLRAMTYALQSDGYISENLVRIADHIGDSNITQIAYAQDPDSVIWCVRADGSLATLTYLPDEGVVAWSRQILGGVFGSGDPVVEQVAVVESPNADHDQVWFLVKRTIDGSTVRYIEFLEDEFSTSADITDAFFVDCGFTYDSTATTTISGLWHLEGETVDVLADGAPISQKTVSDGVITLDTAASTVQVGYAYDSDMDTLSLTASNGGLGGGSLKGRLTSISSIILTLYRTNGGKYGPDSSNLSPILYRVPSDLMDTPIPLYSGDLKLPMEIGKTRNPAVFIRADQPLPFTATAMTVIGSAGDT